MTVLTPKKMNKKSFVALSNVHQLVDINSHHVEKKWHLVWDQTSFQRALDNQCQAILLSLSACEQVNIQRNHCTRVRTFIGFASIIEEAKVYGIKVAGHISCISGSPFNNQIEQDQLIILSEQLVELGCEHVVLADTLARADSQFFERLLSKLVKNIPLNKIKLQFNNASGMALENLKMAINQGVKGFDSSLAGLDGIDFSQSRHGNVSTEDLTFMLQGLGYCQDCDFAELVTEAARICDVVHLPYRSESGNAWLATKH